DQTMLATDLADELVRRGVPFREAHAVVGRVLRAAEAAGCQLSELPDPVLASIHQKLVEPARPTLSPEASAEARRATGGTARAAVLEQLANALQRMA
ncbi:MAG: argininosuccinate lyase, partial [Longimicrobiales bacterium]